MLASSDFSVNTSIDIYSLIGKLNAIDSGVSRH